MPWRLTIAVVLALVVPSLLVPGGAAGGSARTATERGGRPDPVLTSGAVGDPSVARTATGRVVVATGPLAPRARWEQGSGWRWTSRPALARLPGWAREGHVWAPDLARVAGRWVLYFAAPVAGLGRNRRCIGVATAPTAFDRFRPVGNRPLVCHRRADTPLALDPVPGTTGLPRKGVIDPSLFVDADGSPYLLYKTDGQPSSIRLLRLGRRGLAPAAGARSRELIRHRAVVENPVVVRRGDTYHLLTSVGPWDRCGYREVARRSTNLTAWDGSRSEVLLSRRSTDGLCGPAGADVLTVGRRKLLYFHGWAVDGTTRPPQPPFRAGHRGPSARRVLYGARLAFDGGGPVVGRHLRE